MPKRSGIFSQRPDKKYARANLHSPIPESEDEGFKTMIKARIAENLGADPVLMESRSSPVSSLCINDNRCFIFYSPREVAPANFGKRSHSDSMEDIPVLQHAMHSDLMLLNDFDHDVIADLEKERAKNALLQQQNSALREKAATLSKTNMKLSSERRVIQDNVSILTQENASLRQQVNSLHELQRCVHDAIDELDREFGVPMDKGLSP